MMLGHAAAPYRAVLWILSWLLVGAWGSAAVAADPIGVTIPDAWKRPPAGPLVVEEGVVWFRAVVVVPRGWEDQPCEIFVEAVDDARQVFINGQAVGSLGTFPPEYRSGLGQSSRLAIPPGTLLAGEANVVAIRVFNYFGRRGFNVAAPVLFGPDSALRLAGMWQAVTEDDAQFARLSARFDVPEEQWFREPMEIAAAEKELKRLADDAGPLAPSDALSHLKTMDDLQVDLVLADPIIGQPLSLKWDHRGRLWVVEYLQYPDPAGLTAVSRDQFLRTVWDKTPLPPPNHFPGADRISVHEDSNGDGVYDSHSVFLEGLSLITSIALDRDGVWVLNPPHLLYYSDSDHDGVADGDPEVHLEGFGLEDAHSVVNSLRWGPDGWLYGTQGSTVSAAAKPYGSAEEPVRSIGQLVWRYHPASRKYEVFAEGGGNSFGVEIDSQGRVYSGHNGGDTRGFHYVPGGYFRKGFGKHGELSNPYAFGFYEAMAHHRAERFTHTFVIQQSETFPPRFRNHLFGVEPLQGRVMISQMEPDGASFKTTDIGPALWSDGDSWFRPVDIQEGPDGALYIADFYEQRIDHAAHSQGRIHRESGRIYRLRGADSPVTFTLPAADDFDGWLSALESPIRWQRQTALRRVIELADGDRAARLKQDLLASLDGSNLSENAALGRLWAVNQLEPLDPSLLLALLDHPLASVRLWTIRAVGESGNPSPPWLARLTALAADEPDQEVRLQVAATARRLPLPAAVSLIDALILHPQAAQDNRLPLMLWWAIESKVSENPEAMVRWWTDQPARWEAEVVRRELAERFMRRFAASGQRRDLTLSAAILRAAPDKPAGEILLRGFEAAYRGRSLASLPTELIDAMAETGGGSLPLRVRRGDAAAIAEVLAIIVDGGQPPASRVEYLEMLGDVRPGQASGPLLELATAAEQPDAVRVAALAALQGYDSEAIAPRVLDTADRLSPVARDAALTLLASRPAWAGQLLTRVEAKQLAQTSIPDAIVRKLHLHRDEAIRAAIERLWGEISGATTAQMEADIDRYREWIGGGIGNPTVGKKLFATHCGSCHLLFNEGGRTGPDLTSYQRQDVRGMIAHIVNPSLEIREGFENYLLMTDDGRAINGLMVDSDRQVVVIRDSNNQSRTLSRDEIVEMSAVKRSLMPEGLLAPLNEQQVRDLFAYLRSPQPLP